MPQIAPMNPVMYATDAATLDLSTRLSPPYDLVDGRLRARLLERDPLNAVAVDVPHTPCDRPGPADAYGQARRLYERWRSEGVLSMTSRPGYAVTRHSFRDQVGRIHRRLALWAGLPVARPGDGVGVYDHEQTNPGPTGDRVALLRSLRVQTSPIFGLYSDPTGTVEDLLRETTLARPPRFSGVAPDGALHELWWVDNAECVKECCRRFDDRPVVIADGHHRYASAVEYLNDLGDVADDHPARRCLFALTAIEDPGMEIRSLHWVFGGIAGFHFDAFARAAEGMLRIEEVPGRPVDLPAAVCVRHFEGSHAVGLFDFGSGRCFVASSADPDPLRDAFPERSGKWRHADPVVADQLIHRRILRERLASGGTLERWAVADLEALERFEGETAPQLAVVLLPTPLADVLELAARNELLPPDTTFFWPKAPTGLLFHDLEPNS